MNEEMYLHPGEFSTRTVGRALREQWSDSDIQKRDKVKFGTALQAEAEDDYDLEALMAEQDEDISQLSDADQEAYVCEQEKIEAAYALIQQQKPP